MVNLVRVKNEVARAQVGLSEATECIAALVDEIVRHTEKFEEAIDILDHLFDEEDGPEPEEEDDSLG